MKTILILLIYVNSLLVVNAYQEQALEPVIIAPRLTPPKQKKYLVLEKLEEMLYPGKIFNSEIPGKRLDRLEIAVFGSVQSGTIAQRLTRIQNETEAWQIARESSKPNTQGSRQVFQPHPTASFEHLTTQAPRYIQKPRPSYSYMGDRVMSSAIQNLTRRGINALF